jgi:pimeloyl-ACP methyl ester carboxylesterase
MGESSCVIALPVARWGVGNSRSVLLVHGLGASAAGWWRVAAAIAAGGAEVVAPDLRGHGAAPCGASYRFDELAADLARLGAEWDVVVAHSLGGPVVATLLRGGVRTSKLVLLDPVFEIADNEFEAVVADQVAEADPFADPAIIAAENPRWHHDDAFHKAHAARSVSPLTIERVLRDNSPWAHAELLIGLGTPCTVLAGDPAVFSMFGPQLAERVTQADPTISYVVVQGAGHGIHRERPELVVSVVAEGA